MADESDTAAYFVVDRALDRRDVPKSFPALNDDARRQRSDVAVQGLPVSLRGFLEDLHVQDLVRDDFFQSRVLFLESL